MLLHCHCEPEGRGNLILWDCGACPEAMGLLRDFVPRNDHAPSLYPSPQGERGVFLIALSPKGRGMKLPARGAGATCNDGVKNRQAYV